LERRGFRAALALAAAAAVIVVIVIVYGTKYSWFGLPIGQRARAVLRRHRRHGLLTFDHLSVPHSEVEPGNIRSSTLIIEHTFG